MSSTDLERLSQADVDTARVAPVVVGGYDDLNAAIHEALDRTRVGFMELGEGLIRMRESKLYRQRYGTFEAYVFAEFGWSSQHARQLMSATRYVLENRNDRCAFDNEWQVRIKRERERRELSAAKVPVTGGPASVIYADPPWRYDFSLSESREIENQYPTLTLAEICAEDPLPAEDAVLFIWTTSPKLRECFDVIDAWGFTYKTSMVWIKPQVGMGYYARQQHELLLIATLGQLPVPEPEVRPPSVIDARRTKHSAKPNLRPMLDAMYPGLTKREMFSRRPAEGLWLVHGDDAVLS